MRKTTLRLARLSTFARVGLLALLLLAQMAITTSLGENEEAVMDATLYCLFFAAPLLVWLTLEPEPPASRTPGAMNRRGAWLRFPFLAGGASGAVFFVGVFAISIATYLLWLRLVSRQATWFADDDPVQMVMATLYAFVYVLLPVGLCTPLLRRWSGRVFAAGLCAASPWIWGNLFPHGPREPGTITEFGDPWLMVRTILGDGSVIHYARDDLTLLIGLALLGVLVNVPRVVQRWREIARARAAPASANSRPRPVIRRTA